MSAADSLGMGTHRGHGGTVERGLLSTVKSRLYQGRFGRMFRTAPTAEFTEAAINLLADRMGAENESDPTAENAIDDEENFGIPAGYTYFGQFIDHDITFDPLSSLVKQNDPDGLIDFRTPAIDLDSLYGRGPDDQPYMYNGNKFILGERMLQGVNLDSSSFSVPDLPRASNKRAIIGDKRNDENVIVSQLHGLFMRFHNHIADVMEADNPNVSFEEIQQTVRWHYQWLVLFDFLPRIVGRDVVLAILPHLKHWANRFDNHHLYSIYDEEPKLFFYQWKEFPFMPVEFSVAAYRFGHSMIRPIYRLSQKTNRISIFSSDIANTLEGFGEFNTDFGVDWSLFFESAHHHLSPTASVQDANRRVQPAYKIDTSLVFPLSALPEFSDRDLTVNPVIFKPKLNAVNILARRNLLRGWRLGLPSGESVAQLMGVKPLSSGELLIGKAIVDETPTAIVDLQDDDHNPIGQVFSGNTPLWFYVLAEARHGWVEASRNKHSDLDRNTTPTRLGPVGGRIVAEVLIGLLLGDPQSFLSRDPNWAPHFGNLQTPIVFDRFTMGDLIKIVQDAEAGN